MSFIRVSGAVVVGSGQLEGVRGELKFKPVEVFDDRGGDWSQEGEGPRGALEPCVEVACGFWV